ncbi:T-complex protein 11-like protein 1 [Planococcus citri]|uniref:T-complex protein 11-like protein 1 n=1 Tax=Planococcus citri TaxID=170843 RepID=UPI0031F9BDFC
MDPNDRRKNEDIPENNRKKDEDIPERIRQLSESAEEQPGKRQRTISEGTSEPFSPIPGIAGASPPRFVLLEEVMGATRGITNMAIAHEIATNSEFKLEKLQFPQNSLEKKVKDVVHQAFWDLLAENLKQTPPNFDQALSLLTDIKISLMNLLLPRHTKLKQRIDEFLDTELIKQQTEHGTLNFKSYADFVISVMGQICAPVRDDHIKKLATMTDVVQIFRGIMETLELMTLDMANFSIGVIKSDIIACSIEFEKKQFKHMLETSPDSFKATCEWLKRSINPDKPNESKNDILNSAFIELLKPSSYPFPETLLSDESKFKDLQKECTRLNVIATVILVTLSNVGSALSDITEFRNQIKEHICLLLPEMVSESNSDIQSALTSVGDQVVKEGNDIPMEKAPLLTTQVSGGSQLDHMSRLQSALPNVGEQVVKDGNDFLTRHGFNPLSDEKVQLLMTQVSEVSQPDHRIRFIVEKRLYEFLRDAINTERPARLQIPPGLTSIQSELIAVARKLMLIISHNRKVYGEYYLNKLTELTQQNN